MANYCEISEENEKLFNEVLNETSLPKWIVFELLGNDKQKDVYKIFRANEIIEKVTDGLNFIIVLNEEIFDQLTNEQQKIILHECLAGISYDGEKDVIEFNKPDFTSYKGVLNKFGHKEVILLKELIKSLFDDKKQRDDKLMATKRNKKKKIVEN